MSDLNGAVLSHWWDNGTKWKPRGTRLFFQQQRAKVCIFSAPCSMMSCVYFKKKCMVRFSEELCVICPGVKDALSYFLSTSKQSGFSLNSRFCFSWVSLQRTELIRQTRWVSAVWLLWMRVTMCCEEPVSFSWMETHCRLLREHPEH